jgi:type VI secretion system protein ImpE
MNAGELFREGKLNAAVEAATADVKRRPTDIAARYTLCQLLCFTGDLERADTHLDAIASQDAQRAIVVAMTRQLIRAEQARRQFFDEGRLPEMLAKPSDAVRLHLEASICLREGKPDQALGLLDQASELRPAVSGTCDGQPFDDLYDLDDLLTPVMEVLTSTGKYYWIENERIERMELANSESPFDLVWRRVHMDVKDGPDGEVFVPVMYVHSDRETDDALRLGRATDWRGGQGTPVRGIGQRMLLVGDSDRSILEIGEIQFGPAS